MRFLVGQQDASSTPSVYVVNGDQAVNLTALDASIGHDLMNLIHQGDAINRVNGHIKEGGYDVPEYPALFMRGPNSLMPAGAPMIRPTCSEQLDYEVELMVIIGKRGKHISEANAYDHIFAYSVFNDGSVRNYQRKTHQWTPGKNFDATGPIGPFSVTPDELPEGATGLKIESRVGDEILQSANTSEMLWPVARTIATISEYSTLEPGDYIAMGTPPGVGHARTPQRWLRPGETIEVEVEGIGICANPIVAEEDMAGNA